MAARTLVVALGQRRRSAFELRQALAMSSGSISRQLLARYQRASLQDDVERQHELNATKTGSREESGGVQDHTASHRSSVATVMDEDENSPRVESCTEEHGDSDVYDDEECDILVPLPTTVSHHGPGDQSTPKASRASPELSIAAQTQRKSGTILREHTHQELYLFREEAEYSDYVNAMVTGVHTEMDSVIFYEVDVQLSQMKWQVLRRFSEFRQLRQRLVKHLARRQRFQSASKCKICANILQTIENSPFPSRQHRKCWYLVLRGRVCSRKYRTRSAHIVADRKRRLQDFISTCLATVRGLRQHSRLMCDSSACEISVALRMIEEFLGLSFTRYMRFLNERGILGAEEGTKHSKGTELSKALPCHQAAMANVSLARRRATVAV